jgi:uncharacterized membrane protein YgcG
MSAPLPPAGWYPDPDDPARERHWNGTAWTADRRSSPPAPTVAEGHPNAASAPAWRPTRSTWIVGAVALVVALIWAISGGFGAFLVVFAIFVLLGAVYALITRRPSWLAVRPGAAARGLTAGVAAVALIVGAVIGATGHSSTVSSALSAPGASVSATASAAPKTSPTPTPTPTLRAVALKSYLGQASADAERDLTQAGFVVRKTAIDGSSPTDWTGWQVVDQQPKAGASATPGTTVVLSLQPPAPVVQAPPAGSGSGGSGSGGSGSGGSDADSSGAGSSESGSGGSGSGGSDSGGSDSDAPAPAPAPAAPQQPSYDVDPGGYCPDSAVGVTAVASNGHSYTCGGDGPDAHGRYHWNK